MSLFIGGSSALEFWRTVKYRSSVASTKARPTSKAAPRVKEVAAAPFLSVGVVSEPVVLLVVDRESRRVIPGVECRVWGGSKISGSFVRALPGMYVMAPEACFLQMATTLSLVDLIKLGMELCGSYTIQPLARGGFEKRDPLTSAAALRRYVSRAAGVQGVGNARRALKYVVDGSASPAETNLTILLCASTSLGGYGLPLPQMNKRIDIGDKNRGLTQSGHFKCDLFWPQINTAVEYDSDAWHSEERQQVKDASRRNALEAMGVAVVTVTSRQLYDIREMDRVALMLSRRLGRYHSSECKGLFEKRCRLRTTVLA